MQIDMSMAELASYKGTNPKPFDFAEYWDKGIKELNELPLNYEVERFDYPSMMAECFHVYFIGVGGARVHCQLVRPKQQSDKGPGLLWFHGYHGNSGDWIDKVAYAAEGFTVLAMDCRGQGGLSEDNLQVKGSTLKGHIIRGLEDDDPEKLYYRHVFLDTVQAARILMSMDGVDPERIGTYGASQGGALSIVCSALEPRIKKTVAIYPFLSDYRRAWEMDITHSAYEEIHYFFKLRDPNHRREKEFWNKLGYIDIQHLADRIQAEVMWVTAMEDQICPPSTQFAAFNKIVSPKDMVVFYEYGHDYLPTLGDKVYPFFAELLNRK